MIRKKNSHQNSNRADRVKALIKESLAEIFLKEEFLDSENSRISVIIADIIMTPDLKAAKIYIRPFNKENVNKEEFVSLFNNRSYIFFKILSKKLQLKYTPKLIFKYDNTIDHLNNLNYLFQVSQTNQVKNELLDSD